MAKLKIDRGYGVAPNKLLNDPNISLKAKGIFAFLQSKPDNWDFSAIGIAKETKDGRDSIQAGLHELEKHGWLERKKSRNTSGQWDIEYVLHSSPVTTVTENPSPTDTENTVRHRDGKSVDGKPVNNKRNSNKEITISSSLRSEDIGAFAPDEKDFSPIEEKKLEVTHEGNIEEKKVPAENTPAKSPVDSSNDPPVVEYGNGDINTMLMLLRKAVGVATFKNSEQWQRNYTKHIIALIRGTTKTEGIGKEEFLSRMKSILEDPYKRKKCNDIQFLYEELKAFIHNPNSFVGTA